MNFQEFENYIKSLCQSHVDILHVDGSNIGFIRLGSDDALNTMASIIGKNIVLIDNLLGRPVGDLDENKYVQTWYLTFLGHYDMNTSSPTITRDDVIQKVYSIMFDFIARMKKDWYDDSCGPLKGLSFNMTWKYIEDIQLQSHYGFELTINQTVTAPEYDALKWS